MIELKQGSVIERANRIVLGAGITLTQDAEGIPTIDVTGSLTQAAADIRYGRLAFANLWTAANTFNPAMLIGTAGFSTYVDDGLFHANALPGLVVTTPNGGSRKFIVGYQDGGGGQYMPSIGFLSESTGFSDLQILVTKRSADTYTRFFIRHSGWIEWGPGSSPVDTWLRRETGATLQVGNHLKVNGYLYLNTDGQGFGIIGLYDPTKYQLVYSMGAAYIPATSGATLGNLYGMYWAYDNTGGGGYPNITGYNLLHGLGISNNGTTVAYIGSGIWTSGNIVGASGAFNGTVTTSRVQTPEIRATTGAGLQIQISSGTITATFANSGNLELVYHLILQPTKVIYFDGGGDTYIYESAGNQLDFVVGTVMSLRITSNNVAIPATARFYLDGGVDTYIVESAANQVDLYTGGAVHWRATTTSFALNVKDLYLDAGRGIFFDGGSNTYIQEASADLLQIVAGGAISARFAPTYMVIPATNKLYLDGGSDTYIFEVAANIIDFYAGGTRSFVITATNTNSLVDHVITATKRLYLDSGDDTYIYESAANTMRLVAGGNSTLTITTTDVQINPLSKFFLDGGGDTWIYESAANILSLVANGAVRFSAFTGGVSIPAASAFYLDGGSDTYIYEAAANAMAFVVGATERFRVVAAGIQIPTGAAFYPDGGGDTWIYESAANVFDIVVAGTNLLRVQAGSVRVRQSANLVVETGYISVGVSATNGYIYFGTDNSAYIQRSDADYGAGGIMFTPGSYRASGRVLAGTSMNTGGQLRATGWWVSGDSTGLGAELGVSGGQIYLYSYNRSTSSFGVLNLGGSSIITNAPVQASDFILI